MLLVRVSWADRIMALPSSRCSPPPNASMTANRARPRHCSIGPARLLGKSIAGCPIDILYWSPTAPLRPSNSRVGLWYGRTNRVVEIATGTALWYRGGVPPVPIRWLLVRDPTGEFDPQAFLATDLNAHPRDILARFVSRWQVEVTFEEVRAHLGVETQRQWSDKAILRSTPILLGLYSIVTLWTHDLAKARKLKPRTAAWYPKAALTFSDAIAAVRRQIWAHQISFMSRPRRDSIEIPRHIWRRMENALAYAA